MFKVYITTNHMLEHGELASCGVGLGEDTLEKAIEGAIEELTIVPEYDGRAPKSVSIEDADGNGRIFYWPGYWGEQASMALRCDMLGYWGNLNAK